MLLNGDHQAQRRPYARPVPTLPLPERPATESLMGKGITRIGTGTTATASIEAQTPCNGPCNRCDISTPLGAFKMTSNFRQWTIIKLATV